MQGDFLICLDDRSGVSSRTLRLAAWVVRIALALVFAALVTNRVDLWGTAGTEDTLNWLLPASMLRVGGWAATCVEVLLGLALLTGWRCRWVALLSAVVLLLHGAVLSVSLGPTVPTDYFALAAASSAFLLFAIQPATTA